MPAPSQHAFSEKVAVVTDGASPVGRAIALQLALYGAYVIVGNPGESAQGDQALKELQSLGTLSGAVNADVSTSAGIEKLFSEVETRFGRLDLLVNTLGVSGASNSCETDEAGFDKVVAISLKSIYFAVQNAVRLMESRPKGRIVNVLSSCDSEDRESNVVFRAANIAAEDLTKSLSESLPDNFRVNAVAVSEKVKSQTEMDDLDGELFRASDGAEPDVVARAVVFLLSSEAAGINGQILRVE